MTVLTFNRSEAERDYSEKKKHANGSPDPVVQMDGVKDVCWLVSFRGLFPLTGTCSIRNTEQRIEPD